MPSSDRGHTARGVLHVTCGKMAAGKSTLSRRLAREMGALYIGWDLWLTRLHPDEIHTFDDFLRRSARLRDAIGPHLVELLRKGLVVVLDYPANTPSSRQWVRSLVDASDADHRLHFIDISDERCLEQLARRNADLPEDSVPMTEAQFHEITKLFVPPSDAEGFTVVRHLRR